MNSTLEWINSMSAQCSARCSAIWVILNIENPFVAGIEINIQNINISGLSISGLLSGEGLESLALTGIELLVGIKALGGEDSC